MLTLFKNKNFFPLYLAQVSSTFAASLLQNLFVFTLTSTVFQDQAYQLFSVYALYFLSFLLFSPVAGQICDKYAQKKVLLWMKAFEIVLMGFAAFGSFEGGRFLLVLAIAGLGIKACFSRILTYSLFARGLKKQELYHCNLWVKTSIFAAFFVANLLVYFNRLTDFNIPSVFVLALAFSVFGFFNALRVPMQEGVLPDLKLRTTLSPSLKEYVFENRDVKPVLTCMVGIAWMWFVGAAFLFTFHAYVRDILFSSFSVAVLFLGFLASGAVLGALFLGKMKEKNAILLAPLSLMALSVFMADFVGGSSGISVYALEMNAGQFLMSAANIRLLVDAFLAGMCFSCYATGVYTLLQSHGDEENFSQILSLSNIMNAIAVASSLTITLSLTYLFVGTGAIYGLYALANFIFAFYMFQILPEESKRKLLKTVLKFLFKARITGLENLVKAGKRALIVTNHTSYIDALLISVFIPEQITFGVSQAVLDKWWVLPFLSLLKVKPFDPSNPFEAVKIMVEELNQDKLCMFFTENEVSLAHTQMKIYEVPALMAVKAKAALIPVLIKGAKHSVFSRIRRKSHVEFFPHIDLDVKSPVFLPDYQGLTMRKKRLKAAVVLYKILSQLSFEAYETEQTIFDAVTKTMKFAGRFKKMIEDTDKKPVTFQEIFLKSFVLGKLMYDALPKTRAPVGILLPTSNTTLLTILGLQAFGHVPAMLNFSSGAVQVLSTCKTAGIKTVVTAQKVIALGKLETLVEALESEGIQVLRLESLKKNLNLKVKLLGVLGALAPKMMYQRTSRQLPAKPSDVAVVLFTSGSEGLPKAVLLSHKNILSNAYQAVCRVDIFPEDVVLNCLPMFHSFGLVAATFLPLVVGVKTVFYPTPLHYRIIPELCNYSKATIMFGTDTFLAGYAKCANAYDFNTLRLLVSGAEKVKDETRRLWSEKFGIRILEGYGATECSPVISINTPLFSAKGSVGILLPAMEYKLEQVEGIKEGQKLLLKGPNVMLGYMRATNPEVLEPVADGWYDTGDIVHIDENEFIFIKGRSKRFAKIGGEMVSLTAVEGIISEKWAGFIHGVVSIPDAKKGEQMVLITSASDITTEALTALFKQKGMPEISIPKKVLWQNNPPLLGTGKFDYISAKKLAEEQFSQPPAVL
jgi:acyl-[acyl-carrier-protein]-phospholipid O-acyltransferase / long-chain-fatty-acid--[acyl-carrier-protein] ligase